MRSVAKAQGNDLFNPHNVLSYFGSSEDVKKTLPYGRRTTRNAVWENTRVPYQQLDMALVRRRPLHGLLHHSDRGSQYASGDYQQVLAAAGLVCSMSRRGNCWDNAVAESFFATVKVELVHDATWETRAETRTELFEYIEVFYNGQRRHSSLGYLSPRAFERQRAQRRSAA